MTTATAHPPSDDATWRRLAGASTDVLYRFTVEGDSGLALAYVSPASDAVLGYAPEVLMADPGIVLRAMGPDDRAATRQLLAATDLDGPSPARTRTLRWWHPEGRWVVLDCTHVQTREAGRLVGIQGVAVDVTLRQRQQDALVAALARETAAADEARNLAHLQESLLQALSHEVRTPLTAISGFLEVLVAHPDDLDPDERSRFVEVALQNTHRLHRLLDDLLDVGSMARGDLRPTPWLVDLDDHVRRVVPGLPVRGREVVVAPASARRVTFDPDALTRVLEHLVTNAVRHTPPGTHVMVRTEATSPTEAHLVVEDDGPGLGRADLDRVFQPFAQGPAVTGSASPGLGLGLHVVRQLAQLHGGRAWAEHVRPSGTRLRVALLSA